MLITCHTYSCLRVSIIWIVLVCIFQSNVLPHLELLVQEHVKLCKLADANDLKSEKESSEKDIEEEKDQKLRMELLKARSVRLAQISLQTHFLLEFTTIHHPNIVTPPPERWYS